MEQRSLAGCSPQGRKELDMTEQLIISFWAFPGGSYGKESVCNAGDMGLIPEWGRSPGERNDNPIQYSCLKNSMDRGTRWASPWGCKGSDTTEQLTLSHFLDRKLYHLDSVKLHLPQFIQCANTWVKFIDFPKSGREILKTN